MSELKYPLSELKYPCLNSSLSRRGIQLLLDIFMSELKYPWILAIDSIPILLPILDVMVLVGPVCTGN